MPIQVRDPRLLELIRTDSELEQLATGFLFIEGPIWHAQERHLTFSDIPGDTMYRWSDARGFSRVPSTQLQGQRQCLRSARSHSHLRTRHQPPQPHESGRQLRNPGLALRGQGIEQPQRCGREIGRLDLFHRPAVWPHQRPCGRTAASSSISRACTGSTLTPGTLTLLVDDFEKPNGFASRPTSASLFIDDTARNHIRVFDVQADGTLANGRVWANLVGEGVGGADGMKIDQPGQYLLHRARRHPRLRPRCHVPGRDPNARTNGQSLFRR